MEIVTLKMDKEMLERMDSLIKQHQYGTRTEFIRDALRDKMSNLEKEELIKKVMALKGSSKTKTSDEDIRRVREEVSREFLNKFNLK